MLRGAAAPAKKQKILKKRELKEKGKQQQQKADLDQMANGMMSSLAMTTQ